MTAPCRAMITVLLCCSLVGCGEKRSEAARAQHGGNAGPATPATPVPDAGDEIDDGAVPGEQETDAGMLPCTTQEFELSADAIARYRPISIAATAGGFTVAWDEWNYRDQMHLTVVPTTGQPAEHGLLEVENTLDAGYQSPVITPGMMVFKTDMFSLDQRELMAQPLDASFSPLGSPVRLTQDLVEQSVPILIPVDTGFVLVYSEPDGAGTKLIARTLSRSGAPGVAHDIVRSEVPLGSFGATAFAAGVGVSWVAPTASGGDVWIRRTALSGAPLGDSWIVSTEGNAAGGISMVSDGEAALVVFNVLLAGGRSQVRARLLTREGKPSKPEQMVTLGPTQAAGVSAGAYAGGFAVAYRARDADKIETRVSFIHGSTGMVVSSHVTGTSTAMNEATTLAVAPDGTLLVAWSDLALPDAAFDGQGGAVIKASRMTCPEAWLRCSKK